jgi:S-adenosyl-methyltransferase MraW
MDKNLKHTPVMLEEALWFLDLKEDLFVLDATFGMGGHGFQIAERIKPGLLIGLEKDPFTYSLVSQKISPFSNIRLFNVGYEKLDLLMLKLGLNHFDRAFFDLGISSVTLESGRGFSYKKDEVLDLRFDPREGKSAYELIKETDERELEKILRLYGEEKKSKIIAKRIKAIAKNVDILRTTHIAKIVDSLYHPKMRDRSKARVWQALRIYTNNELENLRRGLALALKYLNVGGRLVVITFHSLEDRMVKSLKFYDFVEDVTGKPILPSEEEVKRNPRSRSAKMRVFVKVGEINHHTLLRDRRFANPFRVR